MFSLKDLKTVAKGPLFNVKNEIFIKGVSTDTRTLKKGDLFVALKGPHFDGHDFIEKAFKKGAILCLVSKKVKYPCVVVKDTLWALGELAHFWRKKFKIPIVAVTGSNGKTGTKDLIATLLAEKFSVLKTEGNLNNLIGVPLTLFKLRKKHDIAVIEMGTNQKGEIARLAHIAYPQVGVITNVSSAHLEGLKNLQAVYEEKTALFKEVLKHKGVNIVNVDDPYLRRWYLKNKKTSSSISSHGKGEVLAHNIQLKSLAETSFELNFEKPGFKIPIHLSLIGQHQVQNSLLAGAVALHYGLSLKQIQKGFTKIKPSEGRLKVYKFRGIHFIDDTYNANPGSMDVALSYLATMGRKLKMKTVAILGDMLELGHQSKKLHEELGKKIEKFKIDEVYGFGHETLHTIQNCHTSFQKHFSQHIDIIHQFIKRLEIPCLVLVKGSRGMKMERIIEALKSKLKRN